MNAFVNKDIYPGDVEAHVYYTPKDLEPEPSFEESVS